VKGDKESLKFDTQQAFLFGDMGDDMVYISPPDWWPELVPEGQCHMLLKSANDTQNLNSACRWRMHISASAWMENMDTRQWIKRRHFHEATSEKVF
jgi:hypothetical protein